MSARTGAPAAFAFSEGFQEPKNGTATPATPPIPTAEVAAVKNRRRVWLSPASESWASVVSVICERLPLGHIACHDAPQKSSGAGKSVWFDTQDKFSARSVMVVTATSKLNYARQSPGDQRPPPYKVIDSPRRRSPAPHRSRSSPTRRWLATPAPVRRTGSQIQ